MMYLVGLTAGLCLSEEGEPLLPSGISRLPCHLPVSLVFLFFPFPVFVTVDLRGPQRKIKMASIVLICGDSGLYFLN